MRLKTDINNKDGYIPNLLPELEIEIRISLVNLA